MTDVEDSPHLNMFGLFVQTVSAGTEGRNGGFRRFLTDNGRKGWPWRMEARADFGHQ
jgi:hypothetical protein